MLVAYKAKSAHQIDTVISIWYMKQNQQVKTLSGEIAVLRVKERMVGKGWNVDLNEAGMCYTTVFIMNK